MTVSICTPNELNSQQTAFDCNAVIVHSGFVIPSSFAIRISSFRRLFIVTVFPRRHRFAAGRAPAQIGIQKALNVAVQHGLKLPT